MFELNMKGQEIPFFEKITTFTLLGEGVSIHNFTYLMI